MPLDLLVPDLLLPADAPPAMRALRLPALERWLDGADILRVEARSARDWMAAAFGLPVPAPVAPVTAVADGVVSEGAWLRVDPVHLAIVRDAVVLHPPSVLDVTPSEADALVAALQAHFREDGLEFVAPRADRWYLRVPAGELPATTALEDAIGRNVFGLLPRSAGRIDWRATLNEAQMLLGTHDVNARRERENRPPINSIWPWGGGVLPAPVTSSYEVVAADD